MKRNFEILEAKLSIPCIFCGGYGMIHRVEGWQDCNRCGTTGQLTADHEEMVEYLKKFVLKKQTKSKEEYGK